MGHLPPTMASKIYPSSFLLFFSIHDSRPALQRGWSRFPAPPPPLVIDGKIFRKRWLGEAASLIFLCRKGNDVSARFLPVNAFIRSFRITMHPGPFLSGWKKDMRNHPLRSRGTGARERNDGGEVGDEWLFIAIENISVSGLAADKCDWSRLDRPLSVHRCAKGGV